MITNEQQGFAMLLIVSLYDIVIEQTQECE